MKSALKDRYKTRRYSPKKKRAPLLFTHPLEGFFNDFQKAKKVGRPQVMTPEVLRKLEYAFALDATVEEACVYAGISDKTFYDYQKAHPEFSQRIEALKNMPVLAMRESVIRQGSRDGDLALKYLSKKRSTEFHEKKDIKHGGVVKMESLPKEEGDKIRATFNIFLNSPEVADDFVDDGDETDDDTEDEG